jgi:hypothetical protein
MSCPPERWPERVEGSEDDKRPYCRADELWGSESEQHGKYSAERKASEHKPSCDRNADQAHCEKADGNNDSGRL